MAGKLQTYTTASDGSNNRLVNENAEFYQRVMLERLQDGVFFMPYGAKKNIPQNAGAKTSWRRLEMPAKVTTALVEGTTPTGIDLTINNVNATVAQYGAYTKITDLLDLVGLDPIITETSKLFGDHAAISMDAIVGNILIGGTNPVFANSKASHALLAAGDVISTVDILKIRAAMVKNNVKKIKLPNGKMGYLAFTHPDTVTKIMSLTEWKDQNVYVDTTNREEGIVGQMYGIYFLEVGGAAMPVFTDGGSGSILPGKYTIVIGADAFGIPDIEGSSKPKILVFGDGNTENPLNLYKTVGWKTCFTAVILNDKNIIRYESLDI
jgi:N4-gp56 family major capsid protein